MNTTTHPAAAAAAAADMFGAAASQSRLRAAGDILRTAAARAAGNNIPAQTPTPVPGPVFPDDAVAAFRTGTPGTMLPGEVTLRLRDITDLLHGTMSIRARQDLIREALTLLSNIDAPYSGPLLLTTRCLDMLLHTDGINLDHLIAEAHGITLQQMTDMDTP